MEFKLLGEIAVRIYSVPTSSASSERVWKVFSFIHSKRRNRLGNQKVEKLAYIYINHALADDINVKFLEEEDVMMDAEELLIEKNNGRGLFSLVPMWVPEYTSNYRESQAEKTRQHIPVQSYSNHIHPLFESTM